MLVLIVLMLGVLLLAVELVEVNLSAPARAPVALRLDDQPPQVVDHRLLVFDHA